MNKIIPAKYMKDDKLWAKFIQMDKHQSRLNKDFIEIKNEVFARGLDWKYGRLD